MNRRPAEVVAGERSTGCYGQVAEIIFTDVTFNVAGVIAILSHV